MLVGSCRAATPDASPQVHGVCRHRLQAKARRVCGKEAGIAVKTILRVGNPREVIVQMALSVMADVLIIGSHSKRGLIDVALGGTARHITSRAPCTVLMVSPKT
jgi:nucleotide-binding universal stress UspA family protein